MNKLLIFPLAFMFLLTIFASVFSSIHPTGSSTDYSNQQGGTFQGESGNVTIPEAESQSFNIWDTTGALVILTVAIAVGIIAGIKILGSGLSEMSQGMIFNGILFLGLWACLTIVSGDYLFSEAIVTVVWVSLTTIYIIGMGIHLTASSSGG